MQTKSYNLEIIPHDVSTDKINALHDSSSDPIMMRFSYL